MWKYIIFTLLCLGLQARAQKYMYWYDGDIGTATRGTLSTDRMHFDADISGLSYGFHTLNYALLGEDNSVMSVRFASFYKGMKTKKYLYWFDNDMQKAVGNTASAGVLHLDADISALQPGFHVLNFAVLGEDDAVTNVRFASFCKGMKTKKYLYWFDNDTQKAVSNAASAGILHLDADLSALQPGFHVLNFAVLGEDDAVTSVRFYSFVKAHGLQSDKLRIVYRCDDGASNVADAQSMGDGLYGFSLDVSALENGEHIIYYLLTDGSYTFASGQASFTKTTVSGVGVVTFGKTADSPFYNMNGVKVEHAKKGIYIRNGKKVIVK